MATPSKSGPKTMSSRLATMKFMQRGAAASLSSSPATPEERGGKRQRLSNGSYNASPASTPGGADSSQDAEERKRQDVVEREGVAKGDTKWYLSVQPTSKPVAESPLRIVSAGYSTLDAPARRGGELDDEDIGTGAAAGRMNFGNFSRKQPAKVRSAEDESDSGSDSGFDEDDDEDDPIGAKALIKQSRKEAGDKIRAERKAKRKSDSAESARMAETRRKKEVNLNKVTSISGSGGGGKSTPSSIVCHACGKKGHIKADCPESGSRKSRKLNY